mmetsp:Transcript_16883/g.37981  ORF Transcript_16883/g.37981 Transcript_16883/m.37981 type:complete len:207 (-) Transcript_16883:1776-2396(-)
MTEMTTNMPSEILPDFSKLSESERLEAIRFSEAARRAEERAELRAAERERAKSHALMEERSKVRRDRPQTDASPSVPRDGNSLHDPGGSIGVPASSGRVLFVSKKRRLELASQRILEEKKMKKKDEGTSNAGKQYDWTWHKQQPQRSSLFLLVDANEQSRDIILQQGLQNSHSCRTRRSKTQTIAKTYHFQIRMGRRRRYHQRWQR